MPAKVRRKINIDGYKSIKCNRLKPTKGKNKLKSMPLHIINNRYVIRKVYLCTAFCKIINKLII